MPARDVVAEPPPRPAIPDRRTLPAEPLSAAAAGAAEPTDHVVGVAKQEVGRVDKHPVSGLCADDESEEDGPGKAFFHGPPLIHVVARSPEPVVWLDHENLGSDTLERHDPCTAGLTPIQTDVV